MSVLPRAERWFNLGTEIERLDEGGGGPPIVNSYGGRSLHEQSHGESFTALLEHRLRGDGLRPIACRDTGHLRVTRDFLLHRDKVFDILMKD